MREIVYRCTMIMTQNRRNVYVCMMSVTITIEFRHHRSRIMFHHTPQNCRKGKYTCNIFKTRLLVYLTITCCRLDIDHRKATITYLCGVVLLIYDTLCEGVGASPNKSVCDCAMTGTLYRHLVRMPQLLDRRRQECRRIITSIPTTFLFDHLADEVHAVFVPVLAALRKGAEPSDRPLIASKRCQRWRPLARILRQDVSHQPLV